MKDVKPRDWTANDHGTWKELFDRLDHCRKHQAHPVFAKGIEALGISGGGVPDLDVVNARLQKLTGWQGVYVEGLVDGKEVILDLAERKFPVGNFIRDRRDLNYTPAPDVFHDLYGHLPFLANNSYASFFERLGHLAISGSRA